MISFAVGSTHLNANDLSVIDGVVADWRAQQHKRIVVSAGADKTGSASLNARLADQRGEAIKAALMRRGVPRRAILVDTSLRGQRLAVIEIVAAPKAPSSTCG